MRIQKCTCLCPERFLHWFQRKNKNQCLCYQKLEKQTSNIYVTEMWTFLLDPKRTSSNISSTQNIYTYQHRTFRCILLLNWNHRKLSVVYFYLSYFTEGNKILGWWSGVPKNCLIKPNKFTNIKKKKKKSVWLTV